MANLISVSTNCTLSNYNPSITRIKSHFQPNYHIDLPRPSINVILRNKSSPMRVKRKSCMQFRNEVKAVKSPMQGITMWPQFPLIFPSLRNKLTSHLSPRVHISAPLKRTKRSRTKAIGQTKCPFMFNTIDNTAASHPVMIDSRCFSKRIKQLYGIESERILKKVSIGV